MDYDRTFIPAGYDRGRDHGPEVLDLWMSTVAERVDRARTSRVLDLGCGTGRFSESLAARLDATVIGVDPSKQMLSRARDKRRDRRVSYVRGTAEAIPLPAASVDLVFLSMSLHHFRDRASGTRECRRVLRRGGVLFLRTATREQIPSYAYVPFCPGSRPILERELPSQPELRELFAAAGLTLVASGIVHQTVAPDWAVYAEKLEAKGDSIIARLDDRELHAGLARMRAMADDGDDTSIVEAIDVLIFR